jgi:hypothetical protein
MNYIPDNLVISYHYNGKVRAVYEIDDNGNRSGFYADWHLCGDMWEICSLHNDNRQGVSLLYTSKNKYKIRYFVNGTDVYPQIGMLVKDIKNISPEERTVIALLGITI